MFYQLVQVRLGFIKQVFTGQMSILLVKFNSIKPLKRIKLINLLFYYLVVNRKWCFYSLQCFDAVGWMAGRVYGP